MSRSYERFLPDIEKKLEGLIAAENSAAEAMSYSLYRAEKESDRFFCLNSTAFSADRTVMP